MKKILAILLAAMLTLSFAACTGGKEEQEPVVQPPTAEEEEIQEDVELLQFSEVDPEEEIAVIKTSQGTILIRLFPEQAPKAVENFVTHINEGYYNGLTFHRVINNFMIQGGDPNGNGSGGESIWGEPFEDEFSIQLRNFRGGIVHGQQRPQHQRQPVLYRSGAYGQRRRPDGFCNEQRADRCEVEQQHSG